MYYQELKQARAELTGPGGPFEIETIDLRGNPIRNFKHAPANVRDFWLSTAAFADREYLVYGDERLTYAESHQKTAAIARWMVHNGVKPGDRVAIAMRNYPEWMLIYWACVSMGVAAVGMNAWWVTEEIAYALKDSAPKVLFADQERLDRILGEPSIISNAIVVGVRLKQPLAGIREWAEVVAENGEMPTVDVDPDSDACIFYTSGTTGAPKGAQLTHRGCIANLFNMIYAGQAQALAMARGTGVPIDPALVPPVPVGLITTPLFHVTANNCGAYLCTAAGGKLVLMYRWDATEALTLIEREGVTAMSGVPVMAREVITHPDFLKFNTSSLLSLGGGGAQVPPDLVGKIDAAVATAKPNTGYGMTETCGIITSISGEFFLDRPDSAGPAMPSFEAQVVDDHGAPLPQGEVGELWVRGAPVIKGYLNRPDATLESITGGWLHTGDIARIDEDDFIYIVDRKKDMVLRGGENIFCAEVENSLYRHGSVAECCTFGVPDDRLGEEVGVAIVLRPGETTTPADLRLHVSGILAKHKIPRYVWILNAALPRNASGKFLRRQLRDDLDIADGI